MESLWEGLARRPADPVMFTRLRERLQEGEDWPGLTRLYNLRAEAVGGEEALLLHLAVAECWAPRVGDQEAVRRSVRAAMELGSALGPEGLVHVRESLKELFWARGDWHGMAELLEREAQQSAGQQRAALWMELAELRLAKLGEVGASAEAYARAAAEPDAPVRDIRRRLQEMWSRHPEQEALFEVLRKVYAASLEGPQDAAALQDLLSGRLRALGAQGDPQARGELLLEMGRLSAEFLLDTELALEQLRQASALGVDATALTGSLESLLERVGEDVGLLGALRALYREQSRWPAFVDVGRREAALLREEQGAAVLWEVAQVMEERLGDLEGACALYERAVAVDHSLVDPASDRLRAALERQPGVAAATALLKALYRRQDNDEALLELLEAEESREHSEERRAALLLEMATLCAESALRPDRALEYYEAAADLAAEQDVDRIIQGLLGLHRQGYYLGEVEALIRRVCTGRQRWGALVQMLELLIDGAPDDVTRGRHHAELGRVLEEHTGELERAMHHYQRAFKLDTSRHDYIEAGRQLYRRMGNLEMVARLYDIELKVATGPEEAARLLLDKSRVFAQELEDPARALESLGRACALAPEMEAAHEALEALACGPQGRQAIQTLEEAYLRAGRPAEAAAIHLLVSDRLRERLRARHDLPEEERLRLLGIANDSDLQAWRMDPTSNARVRAAGRLERGLGAQARWMDLAEVLEKRSQDAFDPEDRQDMLLRLGHVGMMRLGDHSLAFEAWQSALEEAPTALRSFLCMEALYRASEEFTAQEGLDQLMDWALDAAPWASAELAPERRATMMARQAQRLEARGEQRGALELWLRLGELSPNDPRALAWFEGRAQSPEGAQDLFRLLERGVVLIDDLDERVARRRRMAMLASEQMRDPLLAIDQHRSILALHGSSPADRAFARGHLRALFREVERYDALATLLEEELAEEGTAPERQRDILAELIEVHQEDRHDLDAARNALGRAIAQQPQERALRLHMADICHDQGAAQEEARVLEALLELCQEPSELVLRAEDQPVRMGDLLERLARLQAEGLQDPQAAVATWRRLLDTSWHDTALDELQRLLVRQRDLEALMSLLEEQAQRAQDTSDKIHFLGRMALLAEHEIQAPQRAIALWRRVLELRPRDVDALQALEGLYEQGQDFEALIATCQERLAVTPDREARAVLLRRMGRVHRQRDALEDACHTYQELLREIPEDLLARQALYEIHKARQDHGALADAIDELLRHESDSNQRRALMLELAALSLDPLEDTERGVRALERLLEEHPQDVDNLRRLLELHTQRGHWIKAAAVLRQLAELSVDSEHRLEMLLRLARVLRQELRDLNQASQVLEEVLELHPANQEALERLEGLYEELRDHEALVRVRDRLVELGDELPRRVQRLLANAATLEAEMEALAPAFDRVVRAHELEPGRASHLEELYRLAEAGSLWRELLAVLAEDASRAPSLEERHRTQHLMAELVEERLDDARQAFDIYRDIFLGAPRRGEELVHLERLAEAHDEFWGEVIALYERLIELQGEPEALASLHWRVAELQREKMQQPREAFVTLRHALQLAQGPQEEAEALARLRALAQRDALWEELVEVGQQRASLAQEDAERVELLLENARLLEEHLEDPARALDALSEAFRTQPSGQVEETLRQRAQQDAASRVRLESLYEELLEQDSDRDHQVEVLGRLACLREACGDPEGAFAGWLRAFHLEPGHALTGQELERLAKITGQVPQVALAYQDAAEGARREEALGFLLHAARLLEEALRAPEAAISVLRKALSLQSDHEQAWGQLERLYRERGDLEALVDLYQQRAERTVDRDRRRAFYLTIAQLLEDGGRQEEAVDFYRRTLRLNPRDLEVLDRLAVLYQRLDEQDRVARCLEQMAEIAAEGQEATLVRTLNRLAHLYVELRRPTRSMEALDRLMQLRPMRRDFFMRQGELMRETGRLEPLIALHESRIATLEALLPELEAFHGAQPAPPEVEAQEELEELEELEGLEEEPEGGGAAPAVDAQPADWMEEHTEDGASLEAVEISADEDLELVEADDLVEELALEEVELVAVPPPPDLRQQRWANAAGEVPTVQQLQAEIRGLFVSLTQMALEELRSPRRAVRSLCEMLERFPEDAEGLAQLASLYAELERWQEHIAVLRRQAELLPQEEPEARAAALRHIASVYEDKLYRPEHAVEVLLQIQEQGGADAALWLEIARLQEKLERWDEAVEALRQAAAQRGPGALAQDPMARVWCRVGEMEEKYRRDADAAFGAYEQALKVDPENTRARTAVIRHLAHGDQWERRVSLLRMEAERAPEGEERARLLREIGIIYRDHGDLEGAQELLGQALAEDVRSLEVLRDLADVAWHRQDWEEVLRVLEVLLDGSFARMTMEGQPLPPERRTGYEAPDDPSFVIYIVRQARALEALGRAEEALEGYTGALKVRSSHLDALLGAGRLAFDAGQQDVAQRHLTRLQAAHDDKLSPHDRAEVAWRLAEILLGRRLHQRALELLREALVSAPGHEKAAQMALDCALHLQLHQEAATHLHNLVEATPEVPQRQALLVRLGNLRAERLEQPEEALESYEAALALGPCRLAAEQALEIYVRLERWEEALEGSLSLVEEAPPQEPDEAWRRQRVRLLLRHARILHLALEDSDEALATCEQAQALDPSNLEPLAQIGSLLGQQGRFEELQSRYRLFMDQLAPEEVALRVEVLRRLGTLLQEDLGAYERALEVFEELRQLVPDDIRVHDALASLYLTEPLYDPQRSLEAHRTVVALGEVSEARFRQVLELHRGLQQEDGVRTLLRLLDFCRNSSRAEQEELRQQREDLAQMARGDLAGAAYHRCVRPALTRGAMAELMRFVTQLVRPALARDVLEETPGAEEISQRRNLNVASIFREVAGVLGLEEVALFLGHEDVSGVQVLMADPAAILIGEDVFRGLFNKEQRFVLGRALENTRPCFVTLASMEPFAAMTFYEALFSYGEDGELGGDEMLRQEIERWRQRLDELMEPAQRQHLRRLVRRALRGLGYKPSVLDWRRAVRASALRVGMLLAGDPMVALKRLLREEERLRSPSVRSFDDLAVAMETSADIREVVLFLLSDDYIKARRLLRGEEVELPPEPELPALEQDEDEPALAPVHEPEEAALEEAELEDAELEDAELEEAPQGEGEPEGVEAAAPVEESKEVEPEDAEPEEAELESDGEERAELAEVEEAVDAPGQEGHLGEAEAVGAVQEAVSLDPYQGLGEPAAPPPAPGDEALGEAAPALDEDGQSPLEDDKEEERAREHAPQAAPEAPTAAPQEPEEEP